ncbi:uncharacterized protein [Fopius arisanus]|uniref:Uncharacterized protein n=1 Tax=Fopius arisanus TaxID=64838 RepID=A0A9R1SZ06_9HYME|nr:PREDICTED: uncharacterized protein LOC105264501 [Fopius arisanus]
MFHATAELFRSGVLQNAEFFVFSCIQSQLAVRNAANRVNASKCSLTDFPQFLELNETYQLAGVIHFLKIGQNEHFIAYCHRTIRKRLKYDDLLSKINYVPNPKCITVSPHPVIYMLRMRTSARDIYFYDKLLIINEINISKH